MKTLLIGNGARENALSWKLSDSPLISKLFVAPGNAGTSRYAENVQISPIDLDQLLKFVEKNEIEFTVVGPEAPLAEGVVDLFQSRGHIIFGPDMNASRIESSKVFSKAIMLANGIPTGKAKWFSAYEDALQYISSITSPIVIKADGLASGKGVVIAENVNVAEDTLRKMMVDGSLGTAGDRILVEEFLEGKEVSVFAFVDGEYVSPMIAACDYKRLCDGDSGPNTGGMGSYSPPGELHWNEELELRVRSEIMEPIARAMHAEGSSYKGLLYLGLMLTSSGPKVIEFNCRFGDPETQVVLPRLESDLAKIMYSTATGNLRGEKITWNFDACVGVVLASEGYPESPALGKDIKGLSDVDDDVYIFQAGTKISQGKTVTSGGRVLTVTARGETLAEARSKVYDNVRRIKFQGSFFRTDIAAGM